VLRETYTEFLHKVQEAELAQSLEAAQHGERVSVLDWAGVPTQPQRTRWKYLAAGLVAALGLGLGVGIVLETFDPVLVSARQVERDSGLPVLGSIPRIA
jgi:capsular polysaccharide biosynthesis protein